MTFKEAIESPLFSHARHRNMFRQDVIHVYHRHSTSPTGVMLVVGVEATPENEAALRQAQHTSPLSPTEGL